MTPEGEPSVRGAFQPASRGKQKRREIVHLTQVGDARLTARTQRLLMLETLPEVQAFIDTHRAFPLKRQTVVTCIATLNKSHPEVKDLWIGFTGNTTNCISRKEVWHAWFWAQRAPQSTFSIRRLSQSWIPLSCPLPQSF